MDSSQEFIRSPIVFYFQIKGDSVGRYRRYPPVDSNAESGNKVTANGEPV